jgi:hypothetical protein
VPAVRIVRSCHYARDYDLDPPSYLLLYLAALHLPVLYPLILHLPVLSKPACRVSDCPNLLSMHLTAVYLSALNLVRPNLLAQNLLSIYPACICLISIWPSCTCSCI